MDLMLKDKIVVITGGAGSVGNALVSAFLEEDAIVISLDKNKERGEKIVKQMKKNGKRVSFIETDISEPASIDKAFNAIFEKFSTLDVLVNNAGVFSSTPVLDIKPSSWDEIMKINLRSVFLCSQKAVQVMMKKGYGKIINIASLGGQTGGIFASAAYSASKAGIICVTKTFAKNFGKFGIRVNCVNPGPLESEMTKDWPPEVLNSLKKSMLIWQDKLGMPSEVAGVIVFLASDKANLIHGAQIDVNGGIYIS